MRAGRVFAFAVILGVAGVLFLLWRDAGEDASLRGGDGATAESDADRIDLAQAEATPDAGAGNRVFTIEAAGSEVYWRIYRAGAAARFGHNHVISVGEMQGSVTLGDDPGLAEWELSFPVEALIIDDPQIRARYGEDFESIPSDDDKAGTKENMLTDRVLNGAVYPEIRLRGSGISGPLEAASLPVTIEMLGRDIEEIFPAAIMIEGDSLTVTGEKRLSHTALGMDPFTALGGLMAVGENIDITYRIHAIAGD